MNKKLVALALFSVMQTTPAFAVVGEENAWFAQLVMWAKNTYNTAMDSLQEAKASSESLTDVKAAAERAYAEYDAVNNAMLTDWRGMVQSDIEALTQLDNMNGASREQQYRILLSELRRRIDDPNTSAAERDELEKQKKLLEKKQQVDKLRDACAENLAKSSGSANERQLVQMTAQCSAAQAVVEADAESRRLEEERLASEAAAKRREEVKKASSALFEMAKDYESPQ